MIENIRHRIDAVHREKIHPHLTRGEAQFDREIAHERAIKLLDTVQSIPLAVEIMDRMFSYDDPILKTRFSGLEAPNPLGLAAGFDKNARFHKVLGQGLGFGNIAVGSITKVKYEGNPKPRVFDLPDSQGLINRMGFPGDGSEVAVDRLKNANKKAPYLLIVNFAASRPSFEGSNAAEITHNAIEAYHDAAEDVVRFGEMGQGNVSSPNTPGVRGLQDETVFPDVVDAVSPVYRHWGKPIDWKFGPDNSQQTLEKNARTIIDKKGGSITVTNTTTDEQIRKGLSMNDRYREEVGGVSGRPLTQKALDVSHDLYHYVGEELPIHRAGGIMNVEDVWDALTYGGATTVNVYTAFVRQETSTPNFTYYILRDLARAMRAHGMTSMDDFRQLRGKEVPFPLTSSSSV